jgi:solute carrier family 25 protein 14/30
MRGFTLAWLRLGPHTIVSFLVYERARALCGLPPL